MEPTVFPNRIQANLRPLLSITLCLICVASVRCEDTFVLSNGMVLRGDELTVPKLGKDMFRGGPEAVEAASISVIDDGLRRTYVHRLGMISGRAPYPVTIEKIEIDQPGINPNRNVVHILSMRDASPLNAFGRKMVQLSDAAGSKVVVVGITELTPRYIRWDAISKDPPLDWEFRTATYAMPAQQIRELLHQRLNMEDVDARLRLVTFFRQAERFDLALQELQGAYQSFPELINQEDYQQQVRQLVQDQGLQVLNEVRLRRNAGQRDFAKEFVTAVHTNQAATEMRIQAQMVLDEMTQQEAQCKSLTEQLASQIQQLPEAMRPNVSPVVEGLRRELNSETLPRLNDYERLGTVESIPLENRVALAVGGWVLGANTGLQNIAEAQSLLRAQPLVSEYLQTENKNRRAQIVDQLKSSEGVSPENLAKMLALIPPPLPLPDQPLAADKPGFYQLSVPASTAGDDGDETASRYLIQLPPEYSPLRRYPCLVVLPQVGIEPASEIEWWCGPFDPRFGGRVGAAARRGYIVISPLWYQPRQFRYQFTGREQDRVLRCLRDAMRRTSIDSDRIFISGHHEGATAAWDIGLSHSYQFAGMVIINGEARRFIPRYRANIKQIASYFICGEAAGIEVNGGQLNSPLERNGAVWDAYMRPKVDCMVTMYQGRGSDNFREDLPRIMEWLELPRHRRAFPREFTLSTMRVSDQFHWLIQLHQQKPKTVISPHLLDYKEYAKLVDDGIVDVEVLDTNRVNVKNFPAEAATVFLSPDFGLKMRERIVINRRGSNDRRLDYQDDLEFMLEDVRRRADRQHPFWASVEFD
jgi:hypothetical protein